MYSEAKERHIDSKDGITYEREIILWTTHSYCLSWDENSTVINNQLVRPSQNHTHSSGKVCLQIVKKSD